MNDQAPTLLVVPTELERKDWLLDGIVLLGAAMGVWELANLGVPLWMPAPLVLPLTVWVLTGEAAGDVPYIGGLAVALRARCGLRRAHEWLFAWAHFFRLRTWPDWKARCAQFLRSSRQRTIRWHRQLSEATRWWRSHASLWASATRYRLSVRRDP